jgi:carbon monoxide dehydrogenase subunit G
MQITASYPFNAPVERVWDLLMDTTAIASCIPGCRELRPLGGDRYQAELTVAIAAVTGQYRATVAMLDKAPPRSYRLVIDGTGRGGFMKGEASISLSPEGDGTLVSVAGEGQVGGAIARVGQRLIESAARMLMDRFFTCLSAKL